MWRINATWVSGIEFSASSVSLHPSSSSQPNDSLPWRWLGILNPKASGYCLFYGLLWYNWHLSEFSSFHSSLFFFSVQKMEFVFIFKYCKDTYFSMLQSALHTSGSQALTHVIQSTATSTHARNFTNKQRQIPSTVSSIQFSLLSISILGIYVLGHKNLPGKISL